MTHPDRRSSVDRLISEGKPLEAAHELALLWTADPSSAAFIVSRYKLISASVPLRPCKVAIERSFTLEPLVPVARAAALVNGIDLTVHLGPFNAYAQEILDASSALYRFDPDVVFLAALTRDVAPELWNMTNDTSDAEGAVQRVVSQFAQLVDAFRAHSSSYLVIHSLEQPPYPNQGILDNQAIDGQMATIRRMNDELRKVAARHAGVYTLDYDGLISRFGSLNWRDEAKWQTVRMPIKAGFHTALAQEWLKFLHPITGKLAKVAAIDLDNTIWGGVVGEDGLSGIKLGNEYPGAAYRAVQQALLELRDRGLLLAICSKNNLDDVMQVFDRHPEMLLKPKHFSAMKINWADKAANLRTIAAELNVGLDAMALIDDNPVERQQVRTVLPEVHVLALPENPLQYADAVRSFPPFERLVLSAEDRARNRHYAALGKVVELKSQAGTKEEFYRSLQQRVIIEGLSDLTVARVAQLTQKTNQFNLTTRRYTEQQISQFANDANRRIYSIRVIDRYADNGIIGAAITRDSQDTCDIDTFLLSCRVIGRSIETALLSYIAQDARTRGIRFLTGRFIPTQKNQPAKSFFSDHGFGAIEDLPSGSTWQLDMRKSGVLWPEWVELLRTDALAQ